ncbi:hypothetical protein BDN71DRAFT_1428446 [Pleurotus eryngii]|uniref:Uncharacterized protein n=1 Tax=Pleurotus eryngii TaxID=5323 RepID=A0A9P6DIE0_PLEER|nr:hypothetical protein BDN71DRAFT_1428446 [Pleurotus eryngii]
MICHLFLNLVEENGCIPLQLVMNKGAEIGDMVHAQKSLRFAPEFSDDKWPPTVQVQSKCNTPIESFWSWQCKGKDASSIFWQLCEGIGGDDCWEQAFAFVNPVLKANADAALGTLGFSEIMLTNVWKIFSAVANILLPS